MPDQTREGLEWVQSGFDLEPRWTREPQLDAIEKVCRRALALSPEDQCTIKFHAEGAFNKLYLVDTNLLNPFPVVERARSPDKLLMRISLPVDPGNKTRGEVTTLRWLGETADQPIPRVITFDDTRDNEIGFEWILMRLMPGVSAYKRWRKMSMAQKTRLVQSLARDHSYLNNDCLRAGFDSIGTLHEATDGSRQPGRLVSRRFFWGDNYDYDVARGPFRTSHDWLSAYLSLIRHENLGALEEAEDDEDREEAEDCLRVATRLTTLLPKIFPSLVHPSEPTILWHDDLSLQNILLDDKGKITAVLDWECVSTKPIWLVTNMMPKFLQGPTREEEPKRDRYADSSETAESPTREDDLDDEGKNGLYWIHLMEYEQTMLRKVYVQYMTDVDPLRRIHDMALLFEKWCREAAHSPLKVDFLGAVDRCADGWHLKGIEKWIDAVEGGTFPRLTDVLMKR
jgi:hypothetical protein